MRKLLLLCLSVMLGCDLFVSDDTRLARQIASDHVAFIRPVSEGYEVAGPDGKPDRIVSKRELSWVSSYVPDFSGFSAAEIEDLSRDMGEFSVLVYYDDLPSVPVLSFDFKYESTDTTLYKLLWTSSDGRSFLISYKNTLVRYLWCDGNLIDDVVAEDVKGFAISDSRIYYLDDFSRLTWSSGVPGGTRSSINLDGVFDGLLPGADGQSLVIYKTNPERREAMTEFHLIDLASGSMAALELPLDGYVFDAVNVRGSAKIVIEVWNRVAERFDGTELTRFYLWDYATGKAVLLFSNEKFYQLHSLPGNVEKIESVCR